MNTAELKIDLINKITNLKEISIIESVKKILEFELDKGEYKLTTAQKNRILEAKDDEILTEEEANNSIEEWLNEK